MTFKNTSIAFLISIGLICLFHFLAGISLWWMLVPFFIYNVLLVIGSANIQSDFHIKALCHGDTNKKQIAITFDDGPNREYTPKVLSLLEQYDAKATFFVIGKNIIGNEEILKRMDVAGHIIGNHTFSHSFFIDFKNANGFKDELNATADSVFKVTGKRMKLFRPPYGVTTPHLVRAAKELNYQVIGWNVRSLDTTNDSKDKITSRVLEQLKPGAIVLFHDTSEKTLNVLKQTLESAGQSGFKIVMMDQLLSTTNYE